MDTPCRPTRKRLFFLILSALAIGCAKSPYIHVNYIPPASMDAFAGQKVYIDFKDIRTDKTFLEKEAHSYFKEFNGRFYLFVDYGDENKKFSGNYELQTLFKETLRIRLKRHGVTVLPTKTDKYPVMEIELKKFVLTLKDKRWIASMEYAARLMYGRSAYVGENISATAERQRILGRGEAEKVLSEAVTDAVNKLDIQRLFEKAVR